MKDNIIAKIEELILPILELHRVELVELAFKQEGQSHILKLLVDKSRGITLNECSEMNHEIADALDKSNIIEGSYTLEVSSPSVDRPLANERDFLRAKGRLVRVATMENIRGMCEHIGEIGDVSEAIVTIIKKDGVVAIPIEKIKWARQEVKI